VLWQGAGTLQHPADSPFRRAATPLLSSRNRW
jgi:hypothetical protein